MKNVDKVTLAYAAIVALVCIWSLFDSRLDRVCERLLHLILPVGLGYLVLKLGTSGGGTGPGAGGGQATH